MPRTTSSAVGLLIEVDDGDDLTSFIETANALITDVCLASEYSEAKLELIERWLSAHFYAIYKPRRLTSKVDVLMEQIESTTDLGFDVTRYGQMAMRLDTAGNLASLNNNTKERRGYKAGVLWLGSEECA